MVRVHLAPADRLAISTLIEGRLLHMRVFLSERLIFSLFINTLGIYAMALNPSFKNDKIVAHFSSLFELYS